MDIFVLAISKILFTSLNVPVSSQLFTLLAAFEPLSCRVLILDAQKFFAFLSSLDDSFPKIYILGFSVVLLNKVLAFFLQQTDALLVDLRLEPSLFHIQLELSQFFLSCFRLIKKAIVDTAFPVFQHAFGFFINFRLEGVVLIQVVVVEPLVL